MVKIKLVIIGNRNNDQRVSHFFKLNPKSSIKVEEYIAPEPFFKRGRFFLLPSDVVFANNALLEAMSYGLVPLVSRVSGSDLIVEHLVSGYIFEHTYDGFKEAIDWAMALSDTEYEQISFAAQRKIETNFSCERYRQIYKSMIESLD